MTGQRMVLSFSAKLLATEPGVRTTASIPVEVVGLETLSPHRRACRCECCRNPYSPHLTTLALQMEQSRLRDRHAPRHSSQHGIQGSRAFCIESPSRRA